jgi:hypothetical protein
MYQTAHFGSKSVKRNPHPLAGPPNDAACPLGLFAWNEEDETVGNIQRGHRLERRTGFGHVTNGTLNGSITELDRASLQHTAAGRIAAVRQHRHCHTPES